MNNFYDRLDKYKRDNKLNYNDLGDKIGKNGDAMRMAVKRESLSELEKSVFEKLFENEQKNDFDIVPVNEPTNPYKKESLSQKEIDSIKDALRDNWNILSKDEGFRLVFTLRASQWVKRILNN